LKDKLVKLHESLKERKFLQREVKQVEENEDTFEVEAILGVGIDEISEELRFLVTKFKIHYILVPIVIISNPHLGTPQELGNLGTHNPTTSQPLPQTPTPHMRCLTAVGDLFQDLYLVKCISEENKSLVNKPKM